MIALQELTRKKQELQVELDRCRALQDQFSQVLNVQMQEASGQFENLASEIKQTVEAITAKQILKPLFTRFANVMTVKNGWICISGTPAAAVQYDKATCFAVHKELKTRFLSTCNTIFSDWAGFQASANCGRVLSAVACMYNSFLSIYAAIPQMRQEAMAEIQAKTETERLSAAEREQAILAQLQQMEDQKCRLMRAAQEMREKADFSDTLECEREFLHSVTLPLGYNDENGRMLDWNLSAKNGVRLIVPKGRLERRDPSVCRFVTNTVYHFFNRYPAGATRLALFDTYKMRELRKLTMDLIDTSDSDDIGKLENAIIYPREEQTGATETHKAFEEICELIEGRDCLDMLLFNREHPDSFQPIVLFVVYGSTASFKLRSELANTIGNARYHGVFMLVVEEAEEDKEDPYNYRSKMEGKSLCELRDMMTVALQSEEDGNLKAEYEGTVYQLATPAQELNVQRFAAQLKERILRRQEMAIPLDKLIKGYTRGKGDFSEILQIPVGREDSGNIKVLSFSSNNATAHCAMTGETGSGKSSILQAIVLGGAYFYSPEEIEFYLIDMKDGAAFYSKGEFDYSQLKHVRMIAANCSTKDLRDFIQYILDNRMSKKEDGSGTNIVAYNKNRTGAERMKRTVIIIDEYTAITDQTCVDDLKQIAAQGRSYGISLILSSHKKGSSGILDNVGNAVEMRSADVGGLIERGNVNRIRSADRVFLTALKGNCISASNEKKGISHFRAAYLRDREQQAFIEQINERYAEYETPAAVIIGDTKRICVRREEAAKKTTVIGGNGAVRSAQIGVSLFGEPYRVSFHEMQTQKLLLLGDRSRAQSIEYSLLSAGRYATNYYLDFGGRASSGFGEVAQVANHQAAIEETLRGVYDLFQSRKGRDWTDPVLVLMHDCSKCGDMLLKKMSREESVHQISTAVAMAEPAQARAAKEESSVEMPSVSGLGMDPARLSQMTQMFSVTRKSEAVAESADSESVRTAAGPSVEMPPVSGLGMDPARLSQLTQMFSITRKSDHRAVVETADRVETRTTKTTDRVEVRTTEFADRAARNRKDATLAELLRELLQDGIHCGICLVVHSDYQGIENASEIFGTTLSKAFPEIIAIPSLEGEAVYAKNNLEHALQLTNASGLKSVIANSAFSNNERVRCYHIVNNDYMQLVPYEWEELL